MNVTPEIVARVKRRLHALNVKGNEGGWICANAPRIRLNAERKPIRKQGWYDVAAWAVAKANALVEPNVTEIRDGRRIGIPTIDGSLDGWCGPHYFALALVAPCPVYLRLGSDAHSLDFDRKDI